MEDINKSMIVKKEMQNYQDDCTIVDAARILAERTLNGDEHAEDRFRTMYNNIVNAQAKGER